MSFSASSTIMPVDTFPDPSPERLMQLVYVSSASKLFSTADLKALLHRARGANIRNHITGLLLYKDGNFMQALEGAEPQIRATFARIVADPRHHGLIKMLDGPIPARNFPDWSMGFRNLNDPAVRSLPGYQEFADQSLAQLSSPSQSQSLLSYFRSTI